MCHARHKLMDAARRAGMHNWGIHCTHVGTHVLPDPWCKQTHYIKLLNVSRQVNKHQMIECI